jgi:hypothetical protein
MMFDLVKSRKIWKNKKSVKEIDYSILLAHVFGEPVKTEQAFMYLFRRYGMPNELHDDYKDLCSYTFHTKDKGIIVRWRMNEGDYHHNLCAFVDGKDWVEYKYGPYRDYNKKLQELMGKDEIYFGGHGIFGLYKPGKNGKDVFCGNEKQYSAIQQYYDAYTGSDDTFWKDADEWFCANDGAIRNKYKDILPYPSRRESVGKSFVCQFNRQVEAGKEQHEWILSLPDDHFLRRVYFAAMALFENWKRPTYIRDVYFDMTCREKRDRDVKKPVKYTNFYAQIKKGGDND